MKRIIIFVILGIVIVFAGMRLLSKPKKAAASGTKRTKAHDSLTVSNRKKGKTGKTSGSIKAKSKEELAIERKQVRIEQKRQKREIRRRKKEEQRAKRGFTKKGRKTRKASQYYIVRAIMTIDNEKYVLIDGVQYTKGEEIMKRRIIDILNDKIVIDEFGRTREVKIGESMLPNLITPKTRQR